MDKHAHDSKEEIVTTPPDTDSSSVPSPSTPLPRSTKKKLFAIIAAALLLSIAITAGTYYYFAIEGAKKDASKTKDATAAARVFASPQALVDEVKVELKGSALNVASVGGVGASTANGFGIFSAPSYQVQGNKFANMPAEIFGAGYTGDSVLAAENYKTLVNFFTTNRFKLVLSAEGIGPISTIDNVPYLSSAVYESSNILCSIWHADASMTDLKAHVSSIGCADKASYKIAASMFDQFYDTYIKAKDDKESQQDLVFGMLESGDGLNGYKYAVLYQEDESQRTSDDDVAYFDGLYYKAPGDKDWTYFIGVKNGLLSCTDYDTPALKAAFNGVRCEDAAGKTGTVR